MSEDPETLLQTQSQQTTAVQASRTAVPQAEGYELLQRLGQGAFGEVWEARQRSTGQKVALKFFQGQPHQLQSLRRELERLREVSDHPVVVNLVDANLESDPAFLVMPLLARSLDHLKAPPTAHQAALWLRQVAEGLRHTHDKGLMHCDVKPSNLMLDPSGAIRLVDFGQSSQAREGAGNWGTLGFMPPEQATQGELLPTVGWDVYALGASFYRLLSGTWPYLSEQQMEALQGLALEERLPEYRQRIAAGRLQPLGSLCRGLDADLVDILEACLRPDPERRLASMGALLEDLDRRQRGEPLLCRRPWSMGYRTAKALAQPVVRVTLVALALLLVGAALALLTLSRAYQSESQALTRFLVQRGDERLTQGWEEEARAWWLLALQRQPQNRSLRLRLAGSSFGLLEVRDQAQTLHWSPGGQGYLLEPTRDARQWKWIAPGESPSEGVVLDIPPGRSVSSLAFDPRGDRVALLLVDTSSIQEELVSYSLKDGRREETLLPLQTLQGPSALVWGEGPLRLFAGQQAYQFFPDARGQRLSAKENAEFSPDGRWLLLDNLLLDLHHPSAPPRRVAVEGTGRGRFSPGGKWLLCKWEGQVVLERCDGQDHWEAPKAGDFRCFCGEEAILVTRGSEAHLYRLTHGLASEGQVFEHSSPILKVRCSEDQKYLLTLTQDRQLWLWDRPGHRLLTHKAALGQWDAGFSPDGSSFYACSPQLRRWRLDPPRPDWSTALEGSIKDLQWGPSQDWMAALHENQVTLLDARGQMVRAMPAAGASSMAVSSRGEVAIGHRQGITLQGKPLASWSAGDGLGQAVCFDRSGERLATLGEGEVVLWSMSGNSPQSLAHVACARAVALALSPDGQQLAIASQLPTREALVHLYRLGPQPQEVPLSEATLPSDGVPPQVAFGPAGMLFCSHGQVRVFAPDGHLSQSWSCGSESYAPPDFGPHTLALPQERGWDLIDLQTLRRQHSTFVAPHSGEAAVYGLRHSADGNWLLATSPGGSWLWDTRERSPLLPLPRANRGLLSADGRRLVLGDEAGRVEAWNLTLPSQEPSELTRQWQKRDGYRLSPESQAIEALNQREWGEL